MWFKVILAAIGILYETLQCVICLVEAVRRKGQPAPTGWVQCRDGWHCQKCRPTGLEYPTL